MLHCMYPWAQACLGGPPYFHNLTTNPHENEQLVSLWPLFSIAGSFMWFLNPLLWINSSQTAQVFGNREMTDWLSDRRSVSLTGHRMMNVI